MADPLPQLLRAEDIAKLLKVEPRTVTLWAQLGDFPAPVIDRPRCKRWHPDHVKRFIETGRTR